MARLKIGFRGAETVVSLTKGETTIGRANKCTIHLPDPDLAEVHFRIRQREKGWQIKDDGSGIGTRVNGKPVYAKTLHHGDVIEAGGLTCQFLSRADAPKRPAAPPPPAAQPARRRAAPPPAAAGPSNQPIPASWIVAAVAVIAVGVGGWMLMKSQRHEDEARVLWIEANAAMDAARADGGRKKLDEARDLLDRIATDYHDTKVARAARVAAEDIGAALSTLKMAERERKTNARDRDAVNASIGRLARLREGAHPVAATRIDAIVAEVRMSANASLAEGFDRAYAEANRLLAQKNYAGALRVWRDYRAPDYSLRKRAERAREKIGRDVARAYRSTLKLAAQRADLDSRIGVLEAARPTFRGTEPSEDLEVRISALRARRTQRDLVVLDKPKPDKPTPNDKGGSDSPAPVTGPYTDPADVTTLILQRDFGEAAATLRGISRHPDARTRVEELTMMATIIADLKAAVISNPAKFTGVLLPEKRGRGDVQSANENEFVCVDREKATVTVPWQTIPIKAFPKLFRQAGFDKPARLETAVLLDELGLANDAAKRYIAFHKSEQAPTTLTRVLARRRGVKAPAEGFVLFRSALVTPSERDRALLLDRIEKLVRQARSTNERRREKAFTELAAIGPPAVEALTLALKDRRKAVADELAKSGAFGPGRFAARLGRKLNEARANALRFIRDPKLYPYPNKTPESQEQAEKLVGKVRDIWDRPFQALLDASDKAQALDTELRKLDERVAKVDPLAVPVYETIVEKIQKDLDVFHIALDGGDKSRIEYNDAVTKYNLELKDTSVDVEERANTDAVNKYRWMMGLRCVKIDERLVRAARKHSIEMQQLKYFAHDSPTAHLKSPTQRVRREGYPGGAAENIARGASSGVQAFEQWYGSSGHHRNMLSPGHTEMGCGAAKHHWWTQKFGRATGRSLTPPKIPPDPDPPGQSGNGQPAPN